MNLNLAVKFGVNGDSPSDCRVSRRSGERQIEKLFPQIQKTSGMQAKLSCLSNEGL
jgi:hypothetical protein